MLLMELLDMNIIKYKDLIEIQILTQSAQLNLSCNSEELGIAMINQQLGSVLMEVCEDWNCYASRSHDSEFQHQHLYSIRREDKYLITPLKAKMIMKIKGDVENVFIHFFPGNAFIDSISLLTKNYLITKQFHIA